MAGIDFILKRHWTYTVGNGMHREKDDHFKLISAWGYPHKLTHWSKAMPIVG